MKKSIQVIGSALLACIFIFTIGCGQTAPSPEFTYTNGVLSNAYLSIQLPNWPSVKTTVTTNANNPAIKQYAYCIAGEERVGIIVNGQTTDKPFSNLNNQKYYQDYVIKNFLIPNPDGTTKGDKIEITNYIDTKQGSVHIRKVEMKSTYDDGRIGYICYVTIWGFKSNPYLVYTIDFSDNSIGTNHTKQVADLLAAYNSLTIK